MALANDRTFLPVSRALITSSAPDTPRELFRAARVPTSSGYRILRFYEQHDAIEVRRTIRVDVRSVVSLQGGLRADQAIPDQAIPHGPPLQDAVAALESADVPCAIGFQTAANLHAYYEPTGPHTLYIGRPLRAADASRLASRARRILADEAPASSTQEYQLYIHDLRRLDIQRDSRGPLTTPIQTLLDLAVHHRYAAHREFLMEMLTKQGALRD